MNSFTFPASKLLLFFCLIGCTASTHGQKKALHLDTLLATYSREFYALNPLTATQQGINDYNNQLEITISDAYLKKTKQLNKKYLAALAKLNKAKLTADEMLSVDMLVYKLVNDNERMNNKIWYYCPVNQFVFSFPTQFATIGSGAGFIPFKTEADYRNFMERMKIFPLWVDQAIANMQQGISKKNTVPKAAMLKVPAQLKPLFETSGIDNIFYKPLLNLPAGLDTAAAAKLKNDYNSTIEKSLKPAYKKLHDYIEQVYIPNARTSSGLLDNKNGKKEYELLLNFHTTTDIGPDSIFNLGLAEVNRIQKEMDSVKNLVGFSGDLKSFLEHVKTAPQFFPFKTDEEVLNRFRSFEERMSQNLNRLFINKPKASFEVRATEKFREAGANAQYMKGSRDGSRPGIFYETVRDPLRYNYFGMESLFIHEAIPGHHYQVSLQMEADIPEFRKMYNANAFNEGWALYAESLGKALGMYNDPYAYFGRLNSEIERALRLVVDAGIHQKGWSREKAIAYLLEYQPVAETQAAQRIERYMVIPGQAVSYKIGELKIIQLRNKAMQQLGNRFNIKNFHDQLLKDGAMPLLLLEQKIDRWIKQESAR